MKKILALLLLLTFSFAQTTKLDFSLIKKGEQNTNVVLIIGGIQGDEPGGFNAANIVATKYRIKKGAVWVIPNLNFYSIVSRHRGIFGDMNRKFASIKQSDPDLRAVLRVKKIMNQKNVKLILNLHDGSGFFRKTYINKNKNPNKWGQSIIIDQKFLTNQNKVSLLKKANFVSNYVNKYSHGDLEGFFHVNNTKTAQGNMEMSKTLTYYAVKNGKEAYGIEASKNYLTHKRAYYHLLAIEGFLKSMDIEFERNFPLTYLGVKNAIENNVSLVLNDKFYLDIKKPRKNLGYVPFPKQSMQYKSSNPLIAVLKKGVNFNIYYGNRHKTILSPQYFNYDNSIKTININIDGKTRTVPLGQSIDVNHFFKVETTKYLRTNIIGFYQKNLQDEAGITIDKKSIMKKYSVDKEGSKFRVEFYNGKKFSGMILINFKPKKSLEYALK